MICKHVLYFSTYDTYPVQDPARQIGKTEECRSEEGATGHKGELYVDAEESGDESTQIRLTDHEKDINMGKEEPEEQSIREKPSDHEKDINMGKEESEEQSIQESPSDHEEEIYEDAKEPEEQNIQKKTTAWNFVKMQKQKSIFRLQSLVIDVGTDVLRKIFDQRLQGVALDDILANEMENLKDLKQQKAITNTQFNLLYPLGGQSSNIAEFDAILMLCLLIHLPSLRFIDFDTCTQRPMPVVASVGTNIRRLCDIMNEIDQLSWYFKTDQLSFNTIKTDIEEVLLSLNATVPKPVANLNERIKRCENKTFDPAADERNKKMFNQWRHIPELHQRLRRRKIVPEKQQIEHIEPRVSKGNEAGITYRQMKSDHEEDIYMEREEPEEQSIQEKPSDATSIHTDDAKDESSDESSEENETEDILWNSEQSKRAVRLQSLIIDVGSDVLRKIFDQRLQGVALDAFLANEMENIKILKQHKAITNAQFNLLYPPDGQPSNIAEFDIALILCMLRHLPSLRFKDFYKCTQWPMPVDVSVGNDILRLCEIINEIDQLPWYFKINQSSFNIIKTDIEEVLLRLNATVPKPLANLNERIKTYENKPLDHAAEQRNKKIFDQWEFVWWGRFAPLERSRTIVTTMRQDFGDINPQVTIQNVKKIDMIGDFRSVMEEKEYVKQDVTSKKKEFKSIEADLKSIKTKDIEHGVSKGNEAESV